MQSGSDRPQAYSSSIAKVNIATLLQEGASQLARSGIEAAANDSRLLLGAVLGRSRTELYLRGDEHPQADEVERFRHYLKRRALREPLAYILGEQEFWSLPFYVNNEVLIPRPETEFLLETVLRMTAGQRQGIDLCLDLCCGSGVIAVVLALELQARVAAVDLSTEALQTARRNCMRHEVAGSVDLVAADLFSPFSHATVFPLIVSNPPYVAREQLDHALQPEVAAYEPRLALDGGDDGLAIIRRIAGEILGRLEPGGMFFMEMGYDQAEGVWQLFTRARLGARAFQEVRILKDYSGRDRVLFARANTAQG